MKLAIVAAAALLLAVQPASAQMKSGFDPANVEHQKILHLLRDNRQKYGDDATILQGLLMAHSVQTEAVLTTESGISGFEDAHGKRFVSYRVASGVIFNDNYMDRDARLSRVWQGILERSFLKYPGFSVPTADGVAIEIVYHHKPYGSIVDLSNAIDEPGPLEKAKFYFLADDIGDFIAQKLPARTLVDRAHVTVDDQPYAFALQELMTVPRPEPGQIAAE
jgi:hypothetical protein